MSAKARAHVAAQWLPVVLFLGFVAAAAVVTNATAASKIAVIANVAAGEPTIAPQLVQPAPAARTERPPQSFVIASLIEETPRAAPIAPPVTTPPLRATIAPLISSTPAPAPARFFTISEVMARRGRAPQNRSPDNVQLASIEPTATPADTATGKSEEPFGLFTFVAPDGQLWTKWRKVADDVRSQEPALLRCLADAAQCSPAGARFAAIVKDAREQHGRARLDLVNRRVNASIHYTSDLAQWGTADLWSAPFTAGSRGSFDTGLGDCEDFAIAKYVALRAAGVPGRQLRVLLVHDKIARLDHAVLTANEDGHWYVLDNRWTAAVEDSEVHRFTPLFALDDQGVKLLAVPYASRAIEPEIEPMSEAVKVGTLSQAKGAAREASRDAPVQKFLPGGETADPASSISALGLRPSIL